MRRRLTAEYQYPHRKANGILHRPRHMPGVSHGEPKCPKGFIPVCRAGRSSRAQEYMRGYIQAVEDQGRRPFRPNYRGNRPAARPPASPPRSAPRSEVPSAPRRRAPSAPSSADRSIARALVYEDAPVPEYDEEVPGAVPAAAPAAPILVEPAVVEAPGAAPQAAAAVRQGKRKRIVPLEAPPPLRRSQRVRRPVSASQFRTNRVQRGGALPPGMQLGVMPQFFM